MSAPQWIMAIWLSLAGLIALLPQDPVDNSSSGRALRLMKVTLFAILLAWGGFWK